MLNRPMIVERPSEGLWSSVAPEARPELRAPVDFAQAPFIVIWETTRACALACRFGDESQHPILPQIMHMRRWTHRAPTFRHSSQPRVCG